MNVIVKLNIYNIGMWNKLVYVLFFVFGLMVWINLVLNIKSKFNYKLYFMFEKVMLFVIF